MRRSPSPRCAYVFGLTRFFPDGNELLWDQHDGTLMTTVSPLGLELLRSRPCGSSADAYSGGFRTLVRGDCVGDQGRDQVKPLCDKKLVTVEDQQNPAADFFFFTQNGLQIPGRVIGLMADNLHFGRRGLRLRFRRVRRLGGGRGRS